MKYLLILLFGFNVATTVHAECSDNGLQIFPTVSTIRNNSIFVLEGFVNGQNIILGLNKEHNIYLQSENKKVNLLVVEICVGQYFLAQAILKPEAELEIGSEYELIIDGIPKERLPNRYNKETKKYEPIKFTVVAGNDNESPILTSVPKLIDKSYLIYGCGPVEFVNFDFPIDDNSEVLIKTTVKNLKSNVEATYYINPENDQIRVGHGMCSGPFSFSDSDDFEVEFSFMDASGNFTPWKGDRIKFTKPSSEKHRDYNK